MPEDAYRFQNGRLEPFDDELFKNKETYTEALADMGFTDDVALAGEEGADEQIKIYACDVNEDPRRFLVTIWSMSTEWGRIHVEGLAGLLGLLHHLQPLYPAFSVTKTLLPEFLGIAKRAFEAWHGHPADSFCFQCDKYAYERSQRRKKENGR